MQGVWDCSPGGPKRFKFKKHLIDAVKHREGDVGIEATSLFGNEYDGPLEAAPNGNYYIVGPDPYTKRNWYATIRVTNEGIEVE